MPNTRKCSCRWNKDFFKWRKQIEEANKDDPRGNPCFRLDLSGDTETKQKQITAVLRNLGVDGTSANIKFVNVERHHWSLLRLQHFESTKTKPSTHMRHSDVIKIDHVVEK